MSAAARPGIPPRLWRAAVALFLTVFLAGAGLTSASALWSQQGRVSTQVSTGSWLQPGWSWTPEGLAGQSTPSGGYVHLQLRWNPPAGLEHATYRLTVDPGAVTNGTVKDSRPGPQPATWQLSLHQNLADTAIPLTLTATADGLTSAPVHLRLVFTRDSRVTVQQVSGP